MFSTTSDAVKALLSGWADFFWIVLGSVFFSILASNIAVQTIESSSLTAEQSEVLLFAVSVGAAASYFFLFVFFCPLSSFVSQSRSQSYRAALAVAILLIAAKWTLNRVFDENDHFSLLRENTLVVVLVCLVIPIVEEAFFRGLAWSKFLERSISELGALFSTSILFVLAHLPVDLNSLIQLSAMSLALGLMRYLSGSIWIGVLAHSIMNIVVFFEL